MDIHAIYEPFIRHFRTRRMEQFVALFGVKDGDRVIDVGGTPFNWRLIKVKPHVVLVNVGGTVQALDNVESIVGDGRALDYANESFDIAYSNSVIEHVGTWEDQVKFARELGRVAASYYVQTPNKWFFIEPHLIAPFIHFLPKRLVCRLVRYFSIWGLVVRPNRRRAEEFVNGISLLGEREVRRLFPDAEIHRERFLGMTKSLIAVRRAAGRG